MAYGRFVCRGPEEGTLIVVCAWMIVGIESYSTKSLKLASLSRNL